MTKKMCFHCNKLIEDPMDYNMIPLEIPYINLFLHKNCFKMMGGYDNMPIFLSQNSEKIYNYLHKIKEDRQK